MTMTQSQARIIDPVLTTIIQGYRQPRYVGELLFPKADVMASGGQVLEFGREAFLLRNTRRVPGADTKRITFGFLGRAFALENHAIDAVVPREIMRDASKVPGVDMASRAAKLAMDVNLLSLEVAQAELALNAANYDSNHKIALTGISKWSDQASNPGQQIREYKEAVRASIGVDPNVMMLSPQAFNALAEHPLIIDRFKYTSKDSLTPAMLAALFGFERVEVGSGVKAAESGATVTTSNIWNNAAVIAYVPTASRGAEEPSYGYTYTLQGHPAVEVPYWDNKSKSWVYGVSYERAPVISGILAGFLVQTPA